MKKEDFVKRELANTLKEMTKNYTLTSITVTALTKQCGISRGTFYYHFIDIYDLINWIFDVEIIKPLQSHICNNSLSNWHGITKYCLEKMLSNKIFYCKAIKFEGQNNLQQHMQKRNYESWKLLIDKYIEETNYLYDRSTLFFITKFTSQAVCNMVIDWAKNGMGTPIELMAKMDDIATKGIYGVIAAETN